MTFYLLSSILLSRLFANIVYLLQIAVSLCSNRSSPMILALIIFYELCRENLKRF